MKLWEIYFVGLYLFLGYIEGRVFVDQVILEVKKLKPLANEKRMKIVLYLTCMIFWLPLTIGGLIYGFIIYPLISEEEEE